MLRTPVKNECYTVEITDYTTEGAGIGHVLEGFPLFIRDTAIGDLCRVRVMKVKGRYGYARIEELLRPSSSRISPVCPEARRCGGCQFQHIDYAAELAFKEQKVQNHLIRIGGFDATFIEEISEGILGMHTGDSRNEPPSRYRNKAQVPVGQTPEGEITCGFYAGHSHRIIPMEDCALSPAEYGQILRVVCAHCASHHIAPYDEQTGRGFLRHILLRKGFSTGELMVCLIVNRPGDTMKEQRGDAASQKRERIPGQHRLIQALIQIPGMASICVNYNPRRTNVILGDVTEVLWGAEVIRDELCGRLFRIGPRAFYQVNPVQTEALYQQAAVYAGLHDAESGECPVADEEHPTVLWDIYCGIGTIGQTMADTVSRVIGIEVIPEAVENARENAAANSLVNTEYHTGSAEEILPRLVEEREAHAAGRTAARDIVVIDPPRKGCDEACLNAILSLAPERIVYISCDSATLARDLRILADGGYALRQWRAFDLFPRTVHVETV
ncbi:MAG: 23S rRNA (uracil(1939)-C(5))-methyltransferase RlmD, partial [Butyrivibrio sp.]|nr:23S rRNA (uracil(1939)-C(5))-methyltransferase RlmD [Butyrivibrio sp.]